MPGRQEPPSTLRRSPAKAQRTWIEAHDNAVEQYGAGERAHREQAARAARAFGRAERRRSVGS